MGAAYGLEAAIGPGCGDVKLEHEGGAPACLDDGGVDASSHGPVGVGGVHDAARGEGNESFHGVGFVEAEELCHGADAVCGVGVSAVEGAGAFHPAVACAGGVGCVVGGLRGEVVYVGSFEVGDVAEESLPVDFEGLEREEVVAAVFGHEAVAAGGFCCADEAAAFFEGGGCRHFDGGVLAAVHGFDGHGGVCAPFGADVDEVCPGQSAGFAPCAGSCEAEGGGAACKAQRLLRGFHAPGIEVGQAHDLRAGNVGIAFKGLHAACAEADEGYADQGDGGTGEWNGCGHGGNL